MTKRLRIVSMVSACVLALGVSAVLAARKQPAPPPPVLCGCLCPDGSFTTTHAPDENSCESACAAACDASSSTF